jgi:hypothetical protein
VGKIKMNKDEKMRFRERVEKLVREEIYRTNFNYLLDQIDMRDEDITQLLDLCIGLLEKCEKNNINVEKEKKYLLSKFE